MSRSRPGVSRTRLGYGGRGLLSRAPDSFRLLRPQREVTIWESSPNRASPRVPPRCRDPRFPRGPPPSLRSSLASQAPPSLQGPPQLYRGPSATPATLFRGNSWVDPSRRRSSEEWTRFPSILRGRDTRTSMISWNCPLAFVWNKGTLSPVPVDLTEYVFCYVFCANERIFFLNSFLLWGTWSLSSSICVFRGFAVCVRNVCCVLGGDF